MRGLAFHGKRRPLILFSHSFVCRNPNGGKMLRGLGEEVWGEGNPARESARGSPIQPTYLLIFCAGSLVLGRAKKEVLFNDPAGCIARTRLEKSKGLKLPSEDGSLYQVLWFLDTSFCSTIDGCAGIAYADDYTLSIHYLRCSLSLYLSMNVGCKPHLECPNQLARPFCHKPLQCINHPLLPSWYLPNSACKKAKKRHAMPYKRPTLI